MGDILQQIGDLGNKVGNAGNGVGNGGDGVTRAVDSIGRAIGAIKGVTGVIDTENGARQRSGNIQMGAASAAGAQRNATEAQFGTLEQQQAWRDAQAAIWKAQQSAQQAGQQGTPGIVQGSIASQGQVGVVVQPSLNQRFGNEWASQNPTVLQAPQATQPAPQQNTTGHVVPGALTQPVQVANAPAAQPRMTAEQAMVGAIVGGIKNLSEARDPAALQGVTDQLRVQLNAINKAVNSKGTALYRFDEPTSVDVGGKQVVLAAGTYSAFGVLETIAKQANLSEAMLTQLGVKTNTVAPAPAPAGTGQTQPPKPDQRSDTGTQQTGTQTADAGAQQKPAERPAAPLQQGISAANQVAAQFYTGKDGTKFDHSQAPKISANQVEELQAMLGVPADKKYGPQTHAAFAKLCATAGINPHDVDFTDPKNSQTVALMAKLHAGSTAVYAAAPQSPAKTVTQAPGAEVTAKAQPQPAPQHPVAAAAGGAAAAPNLALFLQDFAPDAGVAPKAMEAARGKELAPKAAPLESVPSTANQASLNQNDVAPPAGLPKFVAQAKGGPVLG